MKIAVLDDYQDAVRKLDCFSLMQDHEVKVFNNTVKGVGQLAARVADVEAIVLIRERTRVTRQLLDRLMPAAISTWMPVPTRAWSCWRARARRWRRPS